MKPAENLKFTNQVNLFRNRPYIAYYDLRKSWSRGAKKRLHFPRGTAMGYQISYVCIVYTHTHININCKKCILLIIFVLSKMTPICVPKNLWNAHALVLTQFSGFTTCKVEQLLRGMELQEKSTKRLKHTGNLLKMNLQTKRCLIILKP